MNRVEHLEWCKQRALEYVEIGDLDNAVTSMLSDLTKHPKTADHVGIRLGMMMLIAGQLSTEIQVKNFITGFN